MYFDLEWYHDCGEFSDPLEVLQVLLSEYQEFSLNKFSVRVDPLDWWRILASHGKSKGVQNLT